MSDQMSDETRLQAAHGGGRMDPTHGFQSLHVRTPLEELMASEDGDGPEVDAIRKETMERLMLFFFADGKPERLELPMRRVYAVAKAFFPELIDGMSLDALGEVFDEDKPERARARWSARLKVMVNKPIEEAGGVAHSKYQKAESASAKYSAAQMGNRNRVKNLK